VGSLHVKKNKVVGVSYLDIEDNFQDSNKRKNAEK
jgi:hypothetical protein